MQPANTVLAKRKFLKLTQNEIASKLDISRQHYNAIENFKRKPSVELAMKIGNILKVNWTIFFINSQQIDD